MMPLAKRFPSTYTFLEIDLGRILQPKYNILTVGAGKGIIENVTRNEETLFFLFTFFLSCDILDTPSIDGISVQRGCLRNKHKYNKLINL